jgi:putative ABC transport system ATP-binding protein
MMLRACRKGVIKLIRLKDVSKLYRLDGVNVAALQDINFEVQRGEFVAVTGPSGSGKSTLMNILGCLDVPTSGQYWLEGKEISQLSENQLADIRNQQIGFIFQSFNLLPRFSAMENVEWPLVYRGFSKKERIKLATEALEKVGLADRTKHRPTQLSGGQQQRVAIARALVTDPPIILADEPTGNLDSKSGKEILLMLTTMHRQGKTIILITHDPTLAKMAERYVHTLDGRIVKEEGRVKG